MAKAVTLVKAGAPRKAWSIATATAVLMPNMNLELICLIESPDGQIVDAYFDKGLNFWGKYHIDRILFCSKQNLKQYTVMVEDDRSFR